MRATIDAINPIYGGRILRLHYIWGLFVLLGSGWSDGYINTATVGVNA